MAYSLHIEGSDFSIHEWVTYVEAHPQLTLVHKAETSNSVTGEVIRIELPNTARHDSGFILRISQGDDGKLNVTGDRPGESEIELMKKIADDLGGIVVGDEGEEY